MSDAPFRGRNPYRRAAGFLLLGLAVVAGGLYVVGYVLTSDRVPRGTTVAGVPIGGLRPAAAQRALAEGLRPRVDQPVMVEAGGQRLRLDPHEAGLGVDVAASVAQAGGGPSWNPARMWEHVAGGADYDAVVTVDAPRLRDRLTDLAAEVDRPPREGDVRFEEGRSIPTYPEPGRTLDTEAAADALAARYLADDSGPVTLPVRETAPTITRADVDAALADFARPAMSAPVKLQLGGEDVVLEPAAYGDALSMEPGDGGRLVPALDEKALMAAVRPAMTTVALHPEPARVRLVHGRPRVVPAKKGVTFDPEEIARQFLVLVVQRGAHRTLPVKAVVDRPRFTTADAKALGIREVVSGFTTHYPHADYRNTNLGRAAELVNGTVLRPGETFSLNDTVGERTRENGFTEGFIISNGVYKEDLGGGVSQVATTLFNAAFFAGLRDVEHQPHSFYIDRYPIGREATVAWGAIDLRFQNTTPYGVLIQAWIEPSTPSSEGAIHVRMWSTDYWDIRTDTSARYDLTEPETRHLDDPECVPNDGYGGFDIDVYRYFYRAGSRKLDHKETFHTTYTPSDTVVCGEAPDAA